MGLLTRGGSHTWSRDLEHARVLRFQRRASVVCPELGAEAIWLAVALVHPLRGAAFAEAWRVFDMAGFHPVLT